jgi:hypothetical protein
MANFLTEETVVARLRFGGMEVGFCGQKVLWQVRT